MENKLKTLINQKVISSAAGGAVGTIFLIKLENMSIFYIQCAWRIEHNDSVVVTSTDTIWASDTENNPGGLIGKYTPILEGNRIIDINLINRYDLEILFENRYKLYLFCDVGSSFGDVNWELNVPTENISIEITNQLEERHGTYYTAK